MSYSHTGTRLLSLGTQTGISTHWWVASSVNFEDNDNRWTQAYLSVLQTSFPRAFSDYAHPSPFVFNCSKDQALLYH